MSLKKTRDPPVRKPRRNAPKKQRTNGGSSASFPEQAQPVPTVGRKGSVRADQGPVEAQGLPDQHPVEGVAMAGTRKAMERGSASGAGLSISFLII